MGNIFAFSSSTDQPVNADRCPSVLPENKANDSITTLQVSAGRVVRRVEFNGSHTFLVVVENVLSFEECEEILKFMLDTGFAPAQVRGGDGKLRVDTAVRSCSSIYFSDHAMAERLTERIAPYLPQELHGCNPIGLHESFSGLRYEEGQYFLPHMDRGRCWNDGEKAGQRSMITMQLYLNDGFQGGETRFFEGNSRYLPPSMEYTKSYYDMVPKAGSVCLFQHDIWHSGEPVTNGIKYTVRGDVVYRFRDETERNTIL